MGIKREERGKREMKHRNALSTSRGRSKAFPGKRKRRIPLRGSFEDEGKYYRCWNCGFICNIERDAFGEDENLSGLDFTGFYTRCLGLSP